MKNLYKNLCIVLAGGLIASGCSRYYYEKAGIHYNNMAYSKAVVCYEKVADDMEFPQAKFMLADCYRLMNNKEKFEYWYRQVVQSPLSRDSNKLYFARILFDNGKYAEAKNLLKKYLKKVPEDARAITLLSTLDTMQIYFVDSSAYSIKLLDINSPAASSFGATYYKDGIIFSSEIQPGRKYKRCDWTGRPYLDLYYASISPGGALGMPEKLNGTINQDYHEGPATVNNKGNIMYFTSGLYAKKNKPGNNINGVNIIRIYKAIKVSGEWTNIKEVPLLNNDLYSVGHPALSPDDKKLYFISDMEGGFGGTDIYVSKWKDGSWGVPENLGPLINSPGNEMFPFMADDGTLYFSSNGSGGMGGMDVFASAFSNNSWSSPRNLGFPVNSFGDDIGFIINRQNKAGFFSSNRESPTGIDYLYSFEKPDPVFLVMGVVVDKDTRKPLSGVPVELFSPDKSLGNIVTDSSGKFSFPLVIDSDYSLLAKNRFSADDSEFSTRNKKRSETFNVTLELNNPVFSLRGIVVEKETGIPLPGTNVQLLASGRDNTRLEIVTDESGNFALALEAGELYTAFASKENYFTRSMDISTQKTKSENIFVRFEIDRIMLNKPIRVDNIHYDYNKWFIRSDAKPELEKLVKLMQDNPAIQIELSSHCDARGSDQHNMRLSQKRAEAAVDYIVSRGINIRRITAKGYGESKLLNKCSNNVPCSEEAHQFNRRTEFTVTGFDQKLSQGENL